MTAAQNTRIRCTTMLIMGRLLALPRSPIVQAQRGEREDKLHQYHVRYCARRVSFSNTACGNIQGNASLTETMRQSRCALLLKRQRVEGKVTAGKVTFGVTSWACKMKTAYVMRSCELLWLLLFLLELLLVEALSLFVASTWGGVVFDKFVQSLSSWGFGTPSL